MSMIDELHSIPQSTYYFSMNNNESSAGLNNSDETNFDNYFKYDNISKFLPNYIPNLYSKLFFIEDNNIQTNNNEDLNNIDIFQNKDFVIQNELDGNISSKVLNNDGIMGLNSNFHIEINNYQINQNSNHNNMLGRKKKNSGLIGKHDKYAENNMTVKFKVYFINTLLEQINSEIKKINLSIKIGDQEYKVDELLDIDQKKVKNINVKEIRQFLNNNLKEVFSFDISNKYKNYPKNYNKLVIEKLYKENITNVTCILDKKVSKCLKYFRKDDKDMFNNKEYSCLKGIEEKYEDLSNYLKNKGHEDKYINDIKKLINDLENIYEAKTPRKTKANNITEDCPY